MTEEINNTQDKATNEYKGFGLFNDVEDVVLRTYNRARVLTNIADSTSKERKISANGMGLILGYFSKIPKEERKGVMEQFVIAMKEQGYVLTAA